MSKPSYDYSRLRSIILSVSCVALIGWALVVQLPGPERSDDGRVIVEYWEKWTGFEAEAMQRVVDDFNASQDRIEVRMLSVSTIDQKLMLAISGGDPPDLAGVWSHTVPVYAERGALIPLDGYLAEHRLSMQRYLPVLEALCDYRGMTWALPSAPTSLGLHWNRRAFSDAGLDPDTPPATLAELDAWAERLTIVRVVRDGQPIELAYPDLTESERTSHRFEIVRLGFSPAIPGWWNDLWSLWFGGEMFDPAEGVTASSQASLEAYRWFAGYVDKYGLSNLRQFASSFGNFASPQDPFISGRVAMVLQGVWMNNFIQMYRPELDWAAGPFPAANDRGASTIAECDCLVIPRGAENAAAAFEFLEYVAQREPAEKLARGQRKTSPLREVSDGFYAAHPHPFAQLFHDLLNTPNAKYVPRVPFWPVYKDEMIAASETVWNHTQPVEAALGVVQSRMSEEWTKTQQRWERVGQHRLAEWRDLANEREAP